MAPTPASIASGLEFNVNSLDTSFVNGLVIDNFADEGILIDSLDEGPVEISDNFIGVDATGSVAVGNGDDGFSSSTRL